MELLFLKLVNLSMVAGWLVLAVLLIRLVFRKAPKWIRCFLWGLVALRLICPISIESVFSLIPSAEPLPQEILYTEAPEVHSGIGVIDTIVNPVLSSTLSPEPGASANPAQIWLFVLAWIWAAGVAAMLLYELISYLLLKRRVATATLLRENIKQSERINSPFVLGLFHPVIYLPYCVADEALTYVIAHEKAHIRRKDHWWKPVGFIFLAIYWFHPLLWVAYVLLCRDIEAACDEKVIREMEPEDRRAYSAALLHCSVRHRVIAACPLAFGEVGVKARIKDVMNYKKPALGIVLSAVAATIVVAICLLTVPKRDVNQQQEIVVSANIGVTIQNGADALYSSDSTELTQPDTGAANGSSLSSMGNTETSPPYGSQTVGGSYDGHHSRNHHDSSHHNGSHH